MQKLVFAVVAFLTLFGVWSSQGRAADLEVPQSRHYRHHVHVWGTGWWDVIRWANGDCKIWHNDSGPPFGDGWVLVWDDVPTIDDAWVRLHRLQDRGVCTL